MELRYFLEDNGVEYKTWKHVDDMGTGYWEKLKPNMTHNDPKLLEWFNTSNEEDLIFIAEERKLCEAYLKSQEEEIRIATEYNKQL